MKKPPRKSPDPGRLRREAEAQASQTARAGLEPAEAQRLLHELQVHQIELEMQNAELERSRTETEAALERYTDLYDFAPVGYLTVRRDGNIEALNVTAARLLGVERATLDARPLHAIGGTESVAMLDRFVRDLFSDPARRTCELVLRAEGQPAVTLELTGVLQDDGATCRVAMLDVSERKKLHAAVAQADRLASIGLLAAGVAHEINNPLTYVLDSVETLAAGLQGGTPPGPEGLAGLEVHARQAADGLQRIKEVARGLTTFSRVERAERQPVDVRRALETALGMTRNELRFRAQLTQQYHEVPKVAASEGRLSQVFLNLLMNAAQAVEHSAAAPHIGVRIWGDKGRVLAEVRDNGAGISVEDQRQIFEPFYGARASGVGVGLGLAISRNLVTELGGEIWVESELGQGSRFVVSLPALVGFDTGQPLAASPVRRGRVLVVDDEPTIRQMLGRLLRHHHDVLLAESAVEATALLEKDRSFDVILCDLMMPEMNGMALHDWLAARDPSAAQRIVFITGGAFTAQASEYLARTRNVVLEKPFEFRQVLALINQRVAARSESRTLES